MSVDTSTEPTWFLVQTEPHKEIDVERRLRILQDFATLLPLLEKASDEPTPKSAGLMCLRCYRKFTSPTALAKHLTNVHGREKTKPATTRDVPLFRGFVFVGFDPAARNWGSINDTRGVVRLFCDVNGRPIPIPRVEMDRLRATLGPGGVRQEPKDLAASWADDLGVQFVVRDGPFAGFPGICMMSAQDRVTLLVSIFGRTSPATLPREMVEREAAA